ncbi:MULTISPECIES: LysR family transcriptional regulator [unclassified Paenibacillus]|uniref:LysR family transcriptional regulator n=1 Tax=unclassified Paenibacillus TaxID=185978 RepID=UPI0024077651|nr:MULTISPECIES: LysR family transcriptional regulator [unclassified Paenibacillus]MDF9839752.1 DNA-binding transcriptional LysR family regulator [Paenibacillus sp. PastF-2]MDF9846332.1 DNA-binding transcriptional LysR family regulator [Paenibacillus sp. PastM-2]MDF9853318.1 DNA-binding transcriptional LysR family regulator [Paenibacillus sp. PastF-1]MDH6478178.1 DNA-binding transcriptional LysR family regulator [Paenibacillus sp. PastH-2]MDH6506323.1 DNA-binding transcriptional LysR family re
MDWFDIHSFVTVVREQSISKAARILHLAQPTLTARLKKLESEFNVPLLERNWKGVQLTEQGHQFLLYAVKLLEDFKEISEKLNETVPIGPDERGSLTMDSGKLKLGILRPLGSFFISPALQLLKDEYPEVQYDITVEMTGYIMELISIHKLHLGIIPYCKPFPGLSSVPLFQEEVVLIAPKNDPLRTALSTDCWKSLLLSAHFFLYNFKFPFRKVMDQSLSTLLGRLPETIHEINDTNTLLNLVSSGFGYTVLPTSYIYDAFDLKKAAPVSLGAGASVIDLEVLPYDIYYLPSFPKRTIYLVYPDDISSHLPLHRIVEDIVSLYHANEQSLLTTSG